MSESALGRPALIWSECPPVVEICMLLPRGSPNIIMDIANLPESSPIMSAEWWKGEKIKKMKSASSVSTLLIIPNIPPNKNTILTNIGGLTLPEKENSISCRE